MKKPIKTKSMLMKINEDNLSKYIVGIVLIVAIIGVISLLLNPSSTDNSDLAGQAIRYGSCTETDGGSTDFSIKGKVVGPWDNTHTTKTNTDKCTTPKVLQEFFCRTDGTAFVNSKDCSTLGTGYTCSDGACVRPSDSDGDGVADSSDTCPGNDDRVDTDGDRIPNGCDTDDDNDGVSDAFESNYGMDPLDPDEDKDYLLTGGEDPDGDGLTNAEEEAAGTDPTNPDTDGDGFRDSKEINEYNTNPTDKDDFPCSDDNDCDSGYSCTDGKCIISADTTSNVHVQQSSSVCIDSDGGLDYMKEGTVRDSGSSYTDYCYDDNQLEEYKCTFGKKEQVAYFCTELGSHYSCEIDHCHDDQSTFNN